MDKVLRGLVIVILVLTVVSLFFANKVFGKRELLMKRNSVLEDQVVKIAKTIEAEDPKDVAAVEAQKDDSKVTERETTNPEKINVLDGYAAKLETQNLPTLNYDNDAKRGQLRSLYAVDAEGNYKISSLDGKPEMKGPGTMQEILDQMLDRAKVQQATLNKTRAELAKMREHVTTTVEEVNQLKTEGRASMKAAKDANDRATTAENAKVELEGKIAKLTSEKRELNAEIANLNGDVTRITEQKDAANEELAKANELVKELKDRLKGVSLNPGASSGAGAVSVASLTTGDKGKIVEANDEYKFVVIELDNAALTEMLGPEKSNPLPLIEMQVRRPGRKSAAGEFVTRIKLRQLLKGKNMVVADILSDWQQVPVEKGDVVFF